MNIVELYEIYRQYPSVQTDTRKLKKGDLFFALKGPNFDANAFAEAALANGAEYAIIDHPGYQHINNTILVDDVLKTLQELAMYHRNQFTIPFIAITGSNGKTTTKELIHAVLSTTFKTYTTEGNLNNHIGVPLTLLKIRPDAEIAVVEMGANHLGEIASYCVYTQPDHGLITNVGKAHLEGFGGYEGVRKGKGELFDQLRNNNGTAFIMWDYDYLHEMSKGIKKIIAYRTAPLKPTGNSPAENNPGSDKRILQMVEGSILESTPFLKIQAGDLTIQTHLVGDYNFPNVLASVAMGIHFGVPPQKIKEALEKYEPSNNRSQLIEKDSNKIIVDAYNANPSSMKAAIENFANVKSDNKVLILGAMAELGPESVKEHLEVVNLIGQYKWEKVILVGGDFLNLPTPFQTFKNAAEAAVWFRQQYFENTYILVKGSRSSQMEKVLDS